MRAIKAFVILASILAIQSALGYGMWRISVWLKACGISDLEQCGVTLISLVLLFAYASIYASLKK